MKDDDFESDVENYEMYDIFWNIIAGAMLVIVGILLVVWTMKLINQ